MEVKLECSRCEIELTELGALLFSPPSGMFVTKHHICVNCFNEIMRKWGGKFK